MKNTTIYLVIFIVLLQYNFLAQELRPKYGLDIQFGANTPAIGLKIHRNFYLDEKSHITFGSGIGVGDGRGFFTIMNDLTYSTGDGRNYLEVGAIGFWTTQKYYTNDFSLFGSTVGNGNYLVAPLIGYKYVSPHFTMVRIHFTPLISNGVLYPWGGISFGIHLKRKHKEATNIGSVRFATEQKAY